MTQIDAVVFDIGGVLLDWNPRHLYRKLFDDEAEMERFLSEVCTPEWHDAHDRGTPTALSCAELAAVHPEYAELIAAWATRSEEMVGDVDDQSVEILRELKETGMPVYALTNLEAEAYPRRLARFPFLRLFDGIVVSGLEKVAKPDPEIFQRLLARYGLRAETTVMIDDSEANLVGADRVGLTTVHFRSAPELRSWLVRAGLLR